MKNIDSRVRQFLDMEAQVDEEGISDEEDEATEHDREDAFIDNGVALDNEHSDLLANFSVHHHSEDALERLISCIDARRNASVHALQIPAEKPSGSVTPLLTPMHSSSSPLSPAWDPSSRTPSDLQTPESWMSDLRTPTLLQPPSPTHCYFDPTIIVMSSRNPLKPTKLRIHDALRNRKARNMNAGRYSVAPLNTTSYVESMRLEASATLRIHDALRNRKARNMNAGRYSVAPLNTTSYVESMRLEASATLNNVSMENVVELEVIEGQTGLSMLEPIDDNSRKLDKSLECNRELKAKLEDQGQTGLSMLDDNSRKLDKSLECNQELKAKLEEYEGRIGELNDVLSTVSCGDPWILILLLINLSGKFTP
ncbi:hypothetical protein CVT25_001380 [Psilocybe cyanescens]|uniref:Uncharacterized protein n=1 Tax=Psilocybe cyanescens TaxID=93625 RepID=A0A409XHG3_PSICY|nr:hypothetical protein CVT25_001380 [Psilocybe cyanescens]